MVSLISDGVTRMGEEEVDEFNLKVLVVGEAGVGKTSIIQRYTQGHFLSTYEPTLGADFALKVIQWNAKSRIHLQLWDVAGQHRFGHMTRVYYKYAMAAFIVYDLSRPETLNTVLKWQKDLIENIVTDDEQMLPIILLGNKCDLNGIGCDVSTHLNAFCYKHGFEGWFPISAKTNNNIDDAMTFIISVILSKKPNQESVRPSTPWFHAQSPIPKNELYLPPPDTSSNARTENSVYKEHKHCC